MQNKYRHPPSPPPQDSEAGVSDTSTEFCHVYEDAIKMSFAFSGQTFQQDVSPHQREKHTLELQFLACAALPAERKPSAYGGGRAGGLTVLMTL